MPHGRVAHVDPTPAVSQAPSKHVVTPSGQQTLPHTIVEQLPSVLQVPLKHVCTSAGQHTPAQSMMPVGHANARLGASDNAAMISASDRH